MAVDSKQREEHNKRGGPLQSSVIVHHQLLVVNYIGQRPTYDEG